MIENKLMKTYTRPDIIFKSGKGSYMFDKDDNAYLDFVAGVAVNSLGHCSPVVTEALINQSKELIHLSNLYWTDIQIELADFLVSASDHDEVFFVNSGTEALETAIKMARKYGKSIDQEKNEILYMENSFHGRSIGALSITGQEKYQIDFMPLMEKTKMVKSNNIDDLISKVNEKTCAVFMEPIQGEGGVIPMDSSFIEKARSLCDKYDALFVFDEVQCGIGRTGTFYAYQGTNIVPDIICLAKGLGGGFPIGAVLGNKKANVLQPGDHGCTFGGSPLACATSKAVVSVINDNEFLKMVTEKGEYIKTKFETELGGHKAFKSVQGKGLMIGVHLTVESKPICEEALNKKLIVIGAGKNVIRIVPALNITYDEIDKGLDILIKIIKEQI